MYVLIIGAISVFVIYYFLTRKYDHWKKKNIPYLKPFPLLGNYADVILFKNNFGTAAQRICEKFPDEPVVGAFLGPEPVLIVKDPEYVKLVTTKDFYYFSGRAISKYSDKEWILLSIFHSHGDQWKVMRQNLTPLFSSAKMKNMFYVIEKCAKGLESMIENETKTSKEQEVTSLFSRFTMDCIATCAFGVDAKVMTEGDKSLFVHVGNKIFDSSYTKMTKLLLRSISPATYYGLGLKSMPKIVLEFFRKLILETFEERKYKQTDKNDFIDLILPLAADKHMIGDSMTNLKARGKKKIMIKVTDDLLAAQCFVFFAAGYETSSTTASFALYELAKDQNSQDRARREITEWLRRRNNCLEYECVTELPFLEQCVDETLRLYPTGGILTREVIEEYRFPNGLTVEPGLTIHLPVFHIQRNPKYFPDPDTFRPERFAPDNKQNIKPYTYMPFGEGPRICIVLDGSSHAELRQWVRGGASSRLERAVLAGQGRRLLAAAEALPLSRRLPAMLARCDALHAAVEKGSLLELQELLESDYNKNKYVLCLDDSGVGLLHKAIFYDYMDIATWLVHNFPQIVHQKDSLGRTPLHYVCMCRDEAGAATLLEGAGARGGVRDAAGHPPAHYRARRRRPLLALPTRGEEDTMPRDTNVIKRHNIRIWCHDCDMGKLQRVVWAGHGARLLSEVSNQPVVKKFLEALPYIMNTIREIHTAVVQNDLEGLMKHSGDPVTPLILSSRDANNMTVMHKAAGLGHGGILKYIADRYPQGINDVDNDGRTPLHYAATVRDDKHTYETLVSYGADESIVDNKGKTPGYYVNRPQEIDKNLLKVIPDAPRTPSSAYPSSWDWKLLDTEVITELNKKSRRRNFKVSTENISSNTTTENTENRIEMKTSSTQELIKALPDLEDNSKSNKRFNVSKKANEKRKTNKESDEEENEEDETNKDQQDIDNMNDIYTQDDTTVDEKKNVAKEDSEQTEIKVETQSHESNITESSNKHDEDLKIEEPDHEEINRSDEIVATENDVEEQKDTNTCPDNVTDFGNDNNEPEEKLLKENEDEIETSQTDEEKNVSQETLDGENLTEEIKENVEMQDNEKDHQIDLQEIVNEKTLVEEEEQDVEKEIQEQNEQNIDKEEVDDHQKNNEEEEDKEEQNNDPVEVPPDNASTEGKHNATNEDDDDVQAHGDTQSEYSDSNLRSTAKMTDTSSAKRGNLSGRSTQDSLIEGLVNGEAEMDSQDASVIQRDGPVHDDRFIVESEIDPEVAELINSANMEMLAALVLNGEGGRLLDRNSNNLELQAFLDNVPTYMKKIQKVHLAAREGNLRDLQEALDRRKFAIARDPVSPNGATPLHVATIFGKTNIIKYLGGRFPETLSAVDFEGRTALHYAAVLPDNGHYFNLLQQLGANVKDLDDNGHSAEEYYKNPGMLKFDQLIADFGISADAVQDMFSDKGTSDGANNGHMDIPIFKTDEGRYLAKCKKVICYFVGVSDMDKGRKGREPYMDDVFTALGDPLIKGLTEVANVKPKDPIAFLATFLHNFPEHEKPRLGTQESNVVVTREAAEVENEQAPASTPAPHPRPIDVVTVDPGGHPQPSPDAPEVAFSSANRDEHGQSMLHFAAARTHTRNALFQLLQESDINLAYRDELYRTARDVSIQANVAENTAEIDRWVLHLAARDNTDKIMELLLEGYDHILDVVDDEGAPISEVVSQRGLDRMSSLLASIPVFEESRENLHAAVRRGDLAAVREAVSAEGGKTLARGKNAFGRTTLHVAVLAQHEEIVGYLVDTCPELLRIGDNLERTPLHYAMGVEKIESLSRALIRAGAKRVLKDLKGRQPTYYFMNKSDILRLKEEEDAY